MIAIILVNWNGHEDTIACLESLLHSERQDFFVVVSDNGSKPGSIEHIIDWCEGRVSVSKKDAVWSFVGKTRYRNPSWSFAEDWQSEKERPFLIILRNHSNLGFAGANNRGIKLALECSDVKHLWLLNNDTVVVPDCLDRLAERMNREPEIGMLGATIAYYDEPDLVQGLGGARFSPLLGRGDHLGKLTSRHDLPPKEHIEPQMSYVMGACMYVSRSFVETVGFMYEGYFLYMEELDWAARNNGRFKMGWEPLATIFHKEGGSIGTSQRQRGSNTSLYYQNVNLLRFNAIHHPTYLPVTLARIAALMIRYLFRSDLAGARIMLLVIMDFLTRRKRRGPITLISAQT